MVLSRCGGSTSILRIHGGLYISSYILLGYRIIAFLWNDGENWECCSTWSIHVSFGNGRHCYELLVLSNLIHLNVTVWCNCDWWWLQADIQQHLGESYGTIYLMQHYKFIWWASVSTYYGIVICSILLYSILHVQEYKVTMTLTAYTDICFIMLNPMLLLQASIQTTMCMVRHYFTINSYVAINSCIYSY